jgi:hypothetical protein
LAIHLTVLPAVAAEAGGVGTVALLDALGGEHDARVPVAIGAILTLVGVFDLNVGGHREGTVKGDEEQQRVPIVTSKLERGGEINRSIEREFTRKHSCLTISRVFYLEVAIVQVVNADSDHAVATVIGIELNGIGGRGERGLNEIAVGIHTFQKGQGVGGVQAVGPGEGHVQSKLGGTANDGETRRLLQVGIKDLMGLGRDTTVVGRGHRHVVARKVEITYV